MSTTKTNTNTTNNTTTKHNSQNVDTTLFVNGTVKIPYTDGVYDVNAKPTKGLPDGFRFGKHERIKQDAFGNALNYAIHKIWHRTYQINKHIDERNAFIEQYKVLSTMANMTPEQQKTAIELAKVNAKLKKLQKQQLELSTADTTTTAIVNKS